MSKTGVIIIHWHNKTIVDQLLKELSTWEQEKYSIIIVDNSQDFNHSSNSIQKLVPNENLGFAGGCNMGMKHALAKGYDYMLLLNADTDVKELDVNAMCSKMQNDDSLAAVSPVLMEMKNGKQTFHKGGKDPIRNSDTRIVVDAKKKSTSELAYLPGTVLLMRSKAVQEIGFLDENYFFSGEVADWFMRLRESQWKFSVLNDVVVEHFNAGNESYRKKHYIYYSLRNRYLLINKFGKDQSRTLMKNWDSQLRRQMLGALIRFDISKFITIYRAVKDGRSGNFGRSVIMSDQ